MNFKNVFKRETKVIAYVVIALTIVVIGTSYALFLQVDKNTDNQVVTAGSLEIIYSDGNKITPNEDGTATCLTPQSDSKSDNGCKYTLSITNNGTLPMKYDLVIYNNDEEVPSGSNFVDHSLIKHSLNRQLVKEGENPVNVNNKVALSTLPEKDGKIVLDSYTIGAKDTIKFSLNIWISDGAEESIVGKYVSLKLGVNGVVDEEQDASNNQGSNS